MSKPVVIGLCGKARAGKDTVAQYIGYLIENHNQQPDVQHEDSYVVGYEAFAAPLKSMIAMLLDFFGMGHIMQPETLQPYIDGDKKEDVIDVIGKSPRYMMQTLGTDWGRKMINEDMWLNSMSERVKMYEQAGDHGYKGSFVLVTDCRFDNEARALKDRHDAVIVQVVRDDVPEAVGDAGHPSEAGISPDLIDLTVHNNAGLEELLSEVRSVLKDVLPEVKEEAGDDEG